MTEEYRLQSTRARSALSIPLILSLSVLFLSCKGERGSAGPLQSGDIRGFVILYDNDAINPHQLADQSGVTVTLEPASIATSSLSDGSWQFTGAPAGIYVLQLTKRGFFTSTIYNVSFVGRGTYFAGYFSVGQIPSARAKNLAVASIDSSGTLVFTGTISPPDTQRAYVCILLARTWIDTARSFEVINYLSSFLEPGATEFSITTSYFRDLDSRQPGYAVAIAATPYFNFLSFNIASGSFEFVTPDAGLSNVVAFAVP